MIQPLETYTDYTQAVKDAGSDLIVLDFYADWCGPCKRLTPVLEELAERFENVHFYKVNVDVHEQLTQEYKIACMPTIHFVRDGESVESVTGANPDAITETLEKYASDTATLCRE